MANLQYGPLCPDGHGVLADKDEWTAKGVIWCAHEEHGGNGRFYRLSEVKHGTFNPNATRVKSEWQVQHDIKAATQAAVREQLKEHRMAAKKATADKPTRTRKVREPKECKCGCGEMTKGGMFRPGHDARYHAALAKAQIAEAAKAEDF